MGDYRALAEPARLSAFHPPSRSIWMYVRHAHARLPIIATMIIIRTDFWDRRACGGSARPSSRAMKRRRADIRAVKKKEEEDT